MKLQYIIDEKGKKKAVVISIDEWRTIEKGIAKLALLNEMKQGFKDLKEHNKGKHKTKSAEEILDKI